MGSFSAPVEHNVAIIRRTQLNARALCVGCTLVNAGDAITVLEATVGGQAESDVVCATAGVHFEYVWMVCGGGAKRPGNVVRLDSTNGRSRRRGTAWAGPS